MNSVAATQRLPQEMIDSAFDLGAKDGMDDEPCLPELYFARRDQIVAYCAGHMSVAGKTLLSDTMLGRLVDGWIVTVTA